jgi:two-component system alkaline phosphatase synthesis response regulator PhoP
VGRCATTSKVLGFFYYGVVAESILIIEDDPDISRVVTTYLVHAGFAVECVSNGKEGFRRAIDAPPALVVLDWMLPGMDGMELLKRLREEQGTPVIMLTARGEAEDRLAAFDQGVDDYVPKPFHPKELVARVRAVLRRGRQESSEKLLRQGELLIDVERREVLLADERLQLTSLEFDLLRTLASHPGRVFRRNELLDRVWGRDFTGVDRVVDVHISNLRQKLERGERQAYLRTVRGVGYKFEEAP